MYNHIVCAKASKYFSSAVCMLVSVCAFFFLTVLVHIDDRHCVSPHLKRDK